MKRLPEEIIQFFQSQGFVIVSTISPDGSIHNSCKGIVEIKPGGLVYLLDLYKGKTYENLRHNPNINITAVDEHKFIGYCLKGKAKIITEDNLSPQLLKVWDKRITSRLTIRILKNILGEKSHSAHPEALLPKPKYLIVLEAKEIVDLRPQHINRR